MNKLYLITLIFLSSCASNNKQDVAKYDHSCPEAGHGACPFCEEIIICTNNLLTNNK